MQLVVEACHVDISIEIFLLLAYRSSALCDCVSSIKEKADPLPPANVESRPNRLWIGDLYSSAPLDQLCEVSLQLAALRQAQVKESVRPCSIMMWKRKRGQLQAQETTCLLTSTNAAISASSSDASLARGAGETICGMSQGVALLPSCSVGF